MQRLRKEIIEVLVRLNRQAVVEESSEFQEVLQLERLVNRELATKKIIVREQSEKKQTCLEQKLAKKEVALAKEVESVINESQSKLKLVSDAVNDHAKPKNYHFQPSNPPPPPRPPTRKEATLPPPAQPPKRMSIAEQNRQRRQLKSRELLLEKEQARIKKQTVTGKVTELPPNPRTSKSVDKPKINQLQSLTPEVAATRGPFPPIDQSRKQAPKQPERIEALQPSKQQQLGSSLPVALQSFKCARSELQFLKEQPTGNKSKPKSFLEAYRKEELGYRQEENKARLSYLKRLSYFVPFKQNSLRKHTDTIERRGWKGCDYVQVLESALSNINGEELDAMMANRKTKAIVLYETRQKSLKIQEGFKCLQQAKAELRAPKILDLQLQFVPENRKGRHERKDTHLSIDSYLLPVYNLILPALKTMLEMRQLSKQDVKLLVELLSLVMTDSRKFITVVERGQLQQFLDSISSVY